MEKTGEKREKVMGYIRFLGFLYDADYNVGSKRHIEEFQGILDGLKLKIKDLMRSVSWGVGRTVNCHLSYSYTDY